MPYLSERTEEKVFMSVSTDPYRISRLWAEFVDPDVEKAYRLHLQSLMARQLRVALWVWGGLLLAFGLLDLQALGWTSAFFILLTCRAAQAAMVFSLALLLRRYPQWAPAGYAVTVLEIIGFVLFLPIYILRPEVAIITVGVFGLMLLAMFLFVPNRLKFMLLAAMVGVLLMLLCIIMNGRSADVVIGAVFILALPVITGFFAAQHLKAIQRRQFAMFNQVRNANRELKKEVERRKLLEEELKRQATTDPLTGLFNRRQYEMLFRRERERCRRQGTSICVAMGDLDQFKRLNDQMGHDSGDIALQHVARLFTSHLREGDVVGRFGGEEFIILLPDTDVAEAASVIERLRRALELSPVPLQDRSWNLTVTFSVSAVLDNEKDVVETLRRVDAGLYQGKREGRNQVVVV